MVSLTELLQRLDLRQSRTRNMIFFHAGRGRAGELLLPPSVFVPLVLAHFLAERNCLCMICHMLLHSDRIQRRGQRLWYIGRSKDSDVSSSLKEQSPA
jgi:hypothetical protein